MRCCFGSIRLSLRHGQALPPLIAPQPSAALPIVPKPAPVPPKPHAPHPPRQPELQVGGGPLRQMRERDASCEARYATPKNRAGENPVTGSERVRQSQAVGPRPIGWRAPASSLRLAAMGIRLSAVWFTACLAGWILRTRRSIACGSIGS